MIGFRDGKVGESGGSWGDASCDATRGGGSGEDVAMARGDQPSGPKPPAGQSRPATEEGTLIHMVSPEYQG